MMERVKAEPAVHTGLLGKASGLRNVGGGRLCTCGTPPIGGDGGAKHSPYLHRKTHCDINEQTADQAAKSTKQTSSQEHQATSNTIEANSLREARGRKTNKERLPKSKNDFQAKPSEVNASTSTT